MRQLWLQLETALGLTLEDVERDALKNNVAMYRDHRLSWPELMDMSHTLLAFSRPTSDARERTEGAYTPRAEERAGTRIEALAQVIATHALCDEDVGRFRHDVLHGEFLAWPDVEDWLNTIHEQERALPSMYLQNVVLPADHDFRVVDHVGIVTDPPLVIDESHPAMGVHQKILDYALSGSKWIHRKPIAHGGILARLERLSTTLAARYRWQPALATVFILTGLPPFVSTLTADFELTTFETAAGQVSALSRITLTIDPVLSPHEVLRQYQAIRQHILGPKYRELHQRQLRLAVFCLDRPAEESAEDRRVAWNQAVTDTSSDPQWAYPPERLGHFTRDAKKALDKLLTPFSPGETMTRFFSREAESHAHTPGEP